MRDGFALCAACTRHVRQAEEKCPFCGAELALRPAGGPRPPGRRSRAEWLAYGGSAVVLFGCTGGDQVVPLASDASPVVDATVEAAGNAVDDGSPDTGPAGDVVDNADVATDAVTRDALADATADREDVPDEGTFPCATNGLMVDAAACNRATEWCYTNHGFLPTGCVPLTSTCAPFGAADACASAFVWDAAACEGGLRSCACVTPTCGSGHCTDDDAGGITVSCGSCYGAPPARIERLAAASSDRA